MAKVDRISDATVNSIAKLIHRNDLDFDDLVDHVHGSLTSTFLPGDKVQLMLKRHGHAADGEVIGKTRCCLKLKDSTLSKNNEIHNDCSSPWKQTLTTYDVKIDAGVIYSVPSDDLVRCPPFPSRNDVRCLLEADEKFASQFWRIKPKILTSDIAPFESPTKVGSASKRKLDMNFAIESTPQKKTKSETTQSRNMTSVESSFGLMQESAVVLNRIGGMCLEKKGYSKRKLDMNCETETSPQKERKDETNQRRKTALLEDSLQELEVVIKRIAEPPMIVQPCFESEGCPSKRNLDTNCETKSCETKSCPQKEIKDETNQHKNIALLRTPFGLMLKPEVVLKRLTVHPPSQSMGCSPKGKLDIHCGIRSSPQTDETNQKRNTVSVKTLFGSMQAPEVVLERIDIPTMPVQPCLEKKRKPKMNSGIKSSAKRKTKGETNQHRTIASLRTLFGSKREPEVVLTRVDVTTLPEQASVGTKLKQVTMFEMIHKMSTNSMSSNSTIKPLPCTKNNINNDKETVARKGEVEIINPREHKPVATFLPLIPAQWTILKAAPLPVPKAIPIPAGLPTSILGDCFFIAEFIGCHAELLNPGTDAIFFPTTAENLVQVFALGSNGFRYLNSMLACLLDILMKGAKKSPQMLIAKKNVSSFTVTVYTASELTRMFLMDARTQETEAISEALVALQTQDVCQLDPVHKASILVAMCHMVLDTDAATVYRDWKISDAMNARRQIAKIKIAETPKKLDKENLKGDGTTMAAPTSEPEFSVSAKEFYGGGNVGNDVKEEKENSIDIVEITRDQATKASKEKQLREKLEEAKRIAKQKREKLLQKLQKLDNMGKLMVRIDPVGIDRYGSRYWMLDHSGYGLVVERNVANYENRANESVSKDFEQSVMTPWCYYNSEDQVNVLKNSLCTAFLPEKRLANELRKHAEIIDGCTRLPLENVEPSDGTSNSVETLREEITTIEDHLFNGSLALVAGRDKWTKKLMTAESTVDFSSCLLKLYFDIPLHSLSGPVWNRKLGDAIPITSASEAEEDEFSRELQGATSISRLHLLLEILWSCIKWDLEVRPSKCQVCHTIGKRFLAVCGWCKTAFHADCILPSLPKLPRHAQWLCSPCEKIHQTSDAWREFQLSAKEKGLKQSGSEQPTCCNSRRNRNSDDLVACSRCHKVYHKKCHKPPLRNTPRGDWKCSKCDHRKKGSDIY